MLVNRDQEAIGPFQEKHRGAVGELFYDKALRHRTTCSAISSDRSPHGYVSALALDPCVPSSNYENSTGPQVLASPSCFWGRKRIFPKAE